MARRKARERARKLREQGWSIGDIADMLNTHKDVIIEWCRDIELTSDQIHHLARQSSKWEAQNKGAQTNKRKALKKRIHYQEQGRIAAQTGSRLHLMGCMLYWAEGGKRRNEVHFVNSDPHMMTLFMRFLREELQLEDEAIRLQIHCHTQDEIEIERIKLYWLDLLNLPDLCLTKIQFKKGTSSRKNRLVNGICAIRVFKTEVVHHIYGAIQQYVGFENEDWLF